MFKRHLGVVTLLGLLIAAAGVILPILWERYKTKTGLELRHLSTISLAERSEGLEKLAILYDGKSIPCVARMEFALVNVGRTPIKKEDLVSPPTITLTGKDSLLDVKIEALDPPNLYAQCSIDIPQNSVIVKFPLMNPSDQIRFSVLAATSDPNFAAEARIVGIKKLHVIDLSRKLTDQKQRRTPWTIYLVGLFTAFCIFFILAGAVPDILKEHATKKGLASGALKIPEFKSKPDYLEFVNLHLKYKTKKEKKPLLDLIDSFPTEGIISQDQQKEFQSRVDNLIIHRSSTIPAFWFLLFLSGLGIWFICTKLF